MQIPSMARCKLAGLPEIWWSPWDGPHSAM